MKVNLLHLSSLVLIVFTINSCSSEVSNANGSSPQAMAYTYNPSELEALALINSYRANLGLNELEQNDHISYKSEEHDNYMIKNKVVSHDDFVARSENIIKVLGAKSVAENIAYNYKTAQGALNAWLKSPGHKKNIEGNFTHFGISIRENSEGKKFYTNIFVKI